MGLAILIWVIGLIIVISIAVHHRDDEELPVGALVVGGISCVIGVFSLVSPMDNVDYKIAPYSFVVENRKLCFDNYTLSENVLRIPSHYGVKTGFINSWKYCDSPIVIEIPSGYQVRIVDNTPSLSPRIIEGGCDE